MKFNETYWKSLNNAKDINLIQKRPNFALRNYLFRNFLFRRGMFSLNFRHHFCKIKNVTVFNKFFSNKNIKMFQASKTSLAVDEINDLEKVEKAIKNKNIK